MVRRLFAGLALFAASPCTAAPLDWLAGRWAGSGEQFARPSVAELEVSSVLAGRFVELRYRVTQPLRFEGRAFYKPGEPGALSGRWFDSRGVEFVLTAKESARTLESQWRQEGGEHGRTRYALRPDGDLEIEDFVVGHDGIERRFARQTLRRASP